MYLTLIAVELEGAVGGERERERLREGSRGSERPAALRGSERPTALRGTERPAALRGTERLAVSLSVPPKRLSFQSGQSDRLLCSTHSLLSSLNSTISAQLAYHSASSCEKSLWYVLDIRWCAIMPSNSALLVALCFRCLLSNGHPVPEHGQ